MALRVWLPLNGNLNNYGISDVTVTNNGATVDNNGKIGKCYKCSGDSRLSFPSYSWMSMKPQNNFSVFFWAKGTTTGWLFACSAWEFRLCPTYIQIHLAGDGRYPARYNGTFNTNTWYHLGFTWSGVSGKLILYLNGVEVAHSDVPSSANYSIASTFNLPYDGPRYLNDFRVYDHCLSAKEVKELAKGLVLHYKLTGPGQANLLHSEKPITNTVSNVTINNDLTYDLTYASAIKDTYLFFNPIETIAGGKTYTLSFNCSGITPSDNITFSYGNVASTGIFKLHNGYNVCTFTKSTSETRDFFDDQAHITDGTHNIRLSNFKLEKGSIGTPWCPSVTDALYSTLRYNSNIEDDCSGYLYNGTKSGTIIWDADSPRYSTSYKLNGANIVGPIPNTLKPTESITMAIWVKLASERTSGELTLFNNYEGGGAGLDISGTSYGMQIYSGGYKAAWVDMTGKMTQWHHFAGTFDGNNIKTYIDGELKTTVAVAAGSTISYQSTTPWSIGINPGPSGGNGGMSGNVSDARIYATALSEADIKELYNTSLSIDNVGNMYTYELKEI